MLSLQAFALAGIFISTLFTVLTWQFAQFVLLLEGFALFGSWSLDLLPKRKVCTAPSYSHFVALVFINVGID